MVDAIHVHKVKRASQSKSEQVRLCVDLSEQVRLCVDLSERVRQCTWIYGSRTLSALTTAYGR
jgi:hypothetical protein